MERDPRVKVREQGGDKVAAIPGLKGRARVAAPVKAGETGAGKERVPVTVEAAVAQKVLVQLEGR
jgi:hypothetical protein